MTLRTKGYVDAAVANVGAGSFVSKAGDTMTGPLTLPADPTAPNQATDRHYVDSGLSVKADVVNGTVPSGELGAGVASSATCLNGNSTWGSCGGGAPAGITYATTALNWTPDHLQFMNRRVARNRDPYAVPSWGWTIPLAQGIRFISPTAPQAKRSASPRSSWFRELPRSASPRFSPIL